MFVYSWKSTIVQVYTDTSIQKLLYMCISVQLYTIVQVFQYSFIHVLLYAWILVFSISTIISIKLYKIHILSSFHMNIWTIVHMMGVHKTERLFVNSGTWVRRLIFTLTWKSKRHKKISLQPFNPTPNSSPPFIPQFINLK